MTASRAREIFADRMAALVDAVDSGDLVSKSPIASERDPARLLRNGLAAVSYAAFEDFVVLRSFEALAHFDSTKIPFSRLPDKLKEAATIAAAKSMSFRVGFEEPAVRLAFMQKHAEFVASTSTSNYRLSPLTFTPNSTNLTAEDVERGLKAVLIDGPWIQMMNIASRVGYGGVGLRERVTDMLKQRNEAAHAAGADISVADLRQLPHDLLAFGLAFDALFSRAVNLITARNAASPGGDPNGKLDNLGQGIAVTFIDPDSRGLAERPETASRAYRRYASLQDALNSSIPRAAKAKALVVVRDKQRRPVDWRVTDL